MKALSEVRKLGLPQWCIGAGAIRSIVFDYQNRIKDTEIRDVDVVYFNPEDTSKASDEKYELLLTEKMPEIPWEVTNQAGVHLWYHLKFGYAVEPLKDIVDAISTWPETCTTVGVTMTQSGDLKVYAPYGLDDLFHLVIRRNPKRVDLKTYHKRIQQKQYHEKWKSVHVIYETES